MAGDREGSRVGGGRWQGLRAPRAVGEGRGKSGSLHGSGKDQSEFINQREVGPVGGLSSELRRV